jgi:hypothetical protein
VSNNYGHRDQKIEKIPEWSKLTFILKELSLIFTISYEIQQAIKSLLLKMDYKRPSY